MSFFPSRWSVAPLRGLSFFQYKPTFLSTETRYSLLTFQSRTFANKNRQGKDDIIQDTTYNAAEFYNYNPESSKIITSRQKIYKKTEPKTHTGKSSPHFKNKPQQNHVSKKSENNKGKQRPSDASDDDDNRLHFPLLEKIEPQTTPPTSFQELGLPEKLTSHLESIGYQKPLGIQSLSLPSVLNRNNVLICSPTGTGKTLTYLLPIITKFLISPQENMSSEGPQVLVLVPTNELAVQIYEELLKLWPREKIYEEKRDDVESDENARSQLIDVLADESIQLVSSIFQPSVIRQNLKKRKKTLKVVIGTPKQLDDVISGNFLSVNNVQLLVVDEADAILDLPPKHLTKVQRENFYNRVRHGPSVLDQVVSKTSFESRQTIMVSATIHGRLRNLARRKYCGIGVTPGSPLPPPIHLAQLGGTYAIPQEISHWYHTVGDSLFDQLKAIETFFNLYKPRSTLVFLPSYSQIDSFTEMLRQRGLPVDKLSHMYDFSGMDIKSDAFRKVLRPGESESDFVTESLDCQRASLLEKFRKGEVRILVATDAMSRGLDLDLSHVIIAGGEHNANEYLHLAGRVGRNGKHGSVITMIKISSLNKLKSLKVHLPEISFEELSLKMKTPLVNDLDEDDSSN